MDWEREKKRIKKRQSERNQKQMRRIKKEKKSRFIERENQYIIKKGGKKITKNKYLMWLAKMVDRHKRCKGCQQ